MGYLVVQILACLLLAFALGLLLGRLFWYGKAEVVSRVHEGELDAARQRIRTLEADLADCRAADTPAFAPTVPPVPSVPPAAGPPAPVLTSGDGILGFGLPAAATTDDLKAISGIGPVIEKQLARLGVVTYKQVAAFSPDEVQRVGEALGVFTNRIAREDWVAQATRLHRETYGESG